MTTLRLPALDPAALEPRAVTNYPPPHDLVVRGRSRRSFTTPLGLSQFGVNLTELAPGAASALRHWHSHEDEFVWVLEGELTLVTDEGKQRLGAGQCAGFPAGVANAHHFINESAARAVYLEVGTRSAEDEVSYPDVDLRCHPGRYTGARFTRRDGTPLDR
jgi:uncharacterized cupin superfamily protein